MACLTSHGRSATQKPEPQQNVAEQRRFTPVAYQSASHRHGVGGAICFCGRSRRIGTRGAKGDNAAAIHFSVLTPRRGSNNIAQGRADAAVTPASAPPWVRGQSKGQALKGRNSRTRTDAFSAKIEDGQRRTLFSWPMLSGSLALLEQFLKILAWVQLLEVRIDGCFRRQL